MSFFLENRALWAVILHPIFFKKKIKIYHLTLIFSNIYLIFYLPPLKPVTIYDPHHMPLNPPYFTETV